MVDAPEKIWIEQDDFPYFYEESELTEAGSPVTEYIRADLCHRPALEPSAARELALEALRSAEQFIENGFEFGFIRKPDEGDTALETLPKIKAAIRALSSPDHVSEYDRGVRDGIDQALEIATGQAGLMADLALEGLPENARVREAMEAALTRFADTLRATLSDLSSTSSPDHADAGKVEGYGWRPIESAPKGTAPHHWDAPSILVSDGQSVDQAEWEGDDGEPYWHATGGKRKSGNFLGYEPTHWRPLPTPPSSEEA